MFNKNQQEGPQMNPIELMEHQLQDLRERIENMDKRFEDFVKDVTSALNVLDNDILDMKENSTSKGGSENNQCILEKIAKDVETLKVVGKLALDNRERVNVLEKYIEKKHPSSKKVIEPAKKKTKTVKKKTHSKKANIKTKKNTTRKK